MGQFNLSTQTKASMEDAEAANTATQQNKSNTKVNVDPKIVLKSVKDNKGEVFRTFRCFLCIFLLTSLALGGFVIFVQLNLTCQRLAEVSAFGADSFSATGHELHVKKIEEHRRKYETLQQSYDTLKRKFDQMKSEHGDFKNRLITCENQNIDMVSAFKTAYEDFSKRAKNCNLVNEQVDLSELRPEDQKFFEVIDFNPNEKDSERITLHSQTRTMLQDYSKATENLKNTSEE